MRVAAAIDYAELPGDYSDTVEGVCATCSRCGHETESFGTGDASIRRSLLMLRESCPRGEHNYYFEAEEQPQSRGAAAYERGYATAIRERPAGLDAGWLRELVTLTHPDRHPPERAELANRATARLLDLLNDNPAGRRR